MITKEKLQCIKDMRIERVDVPEWDDFVYVRSLTGSERDNFERSMHTGMGEDRRENLANLRARLCVLAICDENGQTILSNGDIDWLGEKNSAALERIWQKIQDLSGFSKKDIEHLEKNSGNPQSEKSSSESQKSLGMHTQTIG